MGRGDVPAPCRPHLFIVGDSCRARPTKSARDLAQSKPLTRLTVTRLRGSVVECASPLALLEKGEGSSPPCLKRAQGKSGGGPPHSTTLPRHAAPPPARQSRGGPPQLSVCGHAPTLSNGVPPRRALKVIGGISL